MEKKIKNVVLAIFGIITLPFLAQAQSSYKISDAADNAIKLSGTSTLHDWTMNAHLFSGEAQFSSVENDLQSIQGFNLLLPVKNLKSKDKGLDNNAYKALKTNAFINIVFKLSSATRSKQLNNLYTFKTVGNLSIAGVTKEITMDVHCHVNTNKTITCTGTEKILMTDYNVKPPSFMLGAMSTGNEVTLDFNLIFNK